MSREKQQHGCIYEYSRRRKVIRESKGVSCVVSQTSEELKEKDVINNMWRKVAEALDFTENVKLHSISCLLSK